MSIDRTDYLMYGIKLPYIKNIYDFEETLLPYLEGHQGIEYYIIHDGMNGEYTVFGKELARLSRDDYSSFIPIHLGNICEKSLLLKFHELFDPIVDVKDLKPNLYLFSHYS